MVDGAATEAIAAIDRHGRPPGEGSDERFTLAVFLGLQITRTTRHREQVMFPERVGEWAAGRELTQELVAEYLAQEHLGFAPRPREAEGAFLYVSKALQDGGATSEFAVRMMLRLVEAFVPRLLPLNWSVEVDRKEQLVTSDTPVVVWRKPSPMDEFEGTGIDNAAELRFPLDPGKQLVLSKRPRKPVVWVEPHRVRRCNADMADGCHRFLVGSPTNWQVLDHLRLPPRAPVIRFNVGPLVVEGPDGRKIRDSEVLHVFFPRRALGH